MDLSPDGHLFAGVPMWTDFMLHAWDADTGNELWGVKSEGGCNKVAFSRDGKFLIKVNHGSGMTVVDARNGHPMVECSTREWVSDVAIASTDRFLVTGLREGPGGIGLYDLSAAEKGKVKPMKWPLDPQDYGVSAVALSPDDHRVLAACKDKALRLFDVQSGKVLAKLDHDGSVTCVAFSADGRCAVSGDEKTVRLWRLPDPAVKK